MSARLNAGERASYEKDGYIVLRDVFGDDDFARLETAIDQHLPGNAYAPGKLYPEPAKYTLSEQCPADPELAYIAEHPKLVSVAEQLLGGPSYLTAYVVYIRTPQDVGSLMHNDYKRWRPVGSSMNWLFTIVALTDFDQETGPLLVAPGSHQLHLVENRQEKTLHRGAPEQPPEGQFVDARLKRGDLLLMNMYTWHWAPPNVSSKNRIGVFNKYAAVSAPPATGYFQHSTAVKEAFSQTGQRLVALASDRPLETTRLLLTRRMGDEPQVLLQQQAGGWGLPGGPGWEEDAIPGWDVGSRIGSLTSQVREQIGLELPWVSYVGDFDEGSGLCRVYGFPSEEDAALMSLAGRHPTCRWVAQSGLKRVSAPELVCQAMVQWLAPGIVRGKGLSQAQARVNQYAV